MNNCANCSSEFSMFKRKHHCRSCGNIFCHNCSSKTAMTTAGPRPVRVCDDCYSKLGKFEGLPASMTSDLDSASVVDPEGASPSKPAAPSSASFCAGSSWSASA